EARTDAPLEVELQRVRRGGGRPIVNDGVRRAGNEPDLRLRANRPYHVDLVDDELRGRVVNDRHARQRVGEVEQGDRRVGAVLDDAVGHHGHVAAAGVGDVVDVDLGHIAAAVGRGRVGDVVLLDDLAVLVDHQLRPAAVAAEHGHVGVPGDDAVVAVRVVGL